MTATIVIIMSTAVQPGESVFLNDQEREFVRSAGWPEDLFEKNRPLYFDDPVEFIEYLLLGNFVHRICILRNGTEKLLKN